MLNIYITRHGETKWNREMRIQGWKDSELTDKGTENAISLGERLRQTDLNAIYSSPSGRAVKTAELICSDRRIPIFLSEDLKELNFGDWEGKIKHEIEQDFQQEYFDFWNAPHLYNHKPHKGESLTALKCRTAAILNDIIAENSKGNVLIVTHAVAIRAILSHIMNIPAEKWWEGPFIAGTSLTLVQFDEETFHIKMIGDASHIKMEAQNKE